MLFFNTLWGFLFAFDFRSGYSVAEKVAEEWPKIMKSITNTKKRKKIRTASKTTAEYWSGKIRLERKPGWESSNYFVRIQAHGIRRKMKLDSTIREEAAREAASLYVDILANGWPKEDGIALVVSDVSGLPENPSIEDWVRIVQSKAILGKTTLNKYFEALQTIVGEILKTPRARKPELRAKIKGFPISGLTKKALKDWLAGRVQSASGLDVIASGRALATARSLVVNARSLFSADILEAMGIESEDMPYVPFNGVKPPSKGEETYTSRFDAKRLLATAARELNKKTNGKNAEDDPKFEQWKIIYLALVAGLRYKEIDRLRSQDIMINSCRIAIRPHETFRPKTKASVGNVPVTASAAKVLAGMLKRTSSPWFIKDGTSSRSPNYRAGVYHDAVVDWLRSYEERGVKPLADVPKPLHELRKEAGTLVNHDHGLVATQQFLRHQSITTTAGIYIDAKDAVSTGLS